MYSLKLRVRENEAISRSNAHDLGIGEDSLSATTNSETIKQSDERKLKTSVCQGGKKKHMEVRPERGNWGKTFTAKFTKKDF